jgi:hypothetical protein
LLAPDHRNNLAMPLSIAAVPSRHQSAIQAGVVPGLLPFIRAALKRRFKDQRSSLSLTPLVPRLYLAGAIYKFE